MTPTLPRRLNRCLARLLLGMLLFAQAVMAAHACAPAQRAAVFALPMHATADSCEHQVPVDAASCVTHCSTADQSADTHQVAVAAPPAVALLTIPVAAVRAACRIANLNARDAASGDPPISIRFQVFRI